MFNTELALASSSNLVDRLLRRTVAPHGVTGAECKRFNGALHQMKRRVRVDGELWWLTTRKGLSRDAIAAIQKWVTRLQGAQGLHRYSAWVFETRPALHAHIVFIGNSNATERLRRSAVCDGCEIKLVHDPDGLSRNYLVKERTPQAGYGRTDLGGRIRGAHRIEGGGDRVRLSDELARDALDANLIQEWQRTNATRSAERKKRRLQRINQKKAPRLSGQILLFPDLKPPARLKHFRGGIVPPSVREEIEFQRDRKGLSQRKLAAMVGVSQGQYSNALRGHDRISALVVNRLRDALLA